MWFIQTLIEFVGTVLVLLLVCAVAGVIGSFGFQLRKGLAFVRLGRARSAGLRIGYGIFGCLAIAAGLLFFSAEWKAWLVAAAPALGGFFGWFLIPGEWD